MGEQEVFVKRGDGAAAAKKDPRLGFALEAHKQGRVDEAIRLYNAILATNAKDPQVWNNLGVALRKKKLYAAAAACYERAIQADPKWAGAWSNYGNVLKDLDRFEESLQAHEEALKLEPKSAAHHHHVAIALRLLGQFDRALFHLEYAIQLDPKHLMVNWDLARAYLSMGNYERGWAHYESRWHLEEMKVREFDAPRWAGEDITGKNVLLYAEQGFGDTLLALRFAQWVKDQGAARVLFESQPPLMRLIKDVAGLDHIFPRDSEMPAHHVQSSLMSLPRLYGLTLHNLPAPPQLTWEPADQARLKAIIDRHAKPTELKVGIVWSGSVTFKNNHKRAVELERFLGLAAVPNVKLFSLQKGPPQQALQDINSPSLVVDLGAECKDFADTAAALQELDVVVMTDSSVAHLAGSLDVPVWNLLDTEAYWLYLNHREDSPWYPSMRLIRQKTPGDWAGVFTQVAGDLQGIAARKAAGQLDLKRALLPHLLAG